MSEARGAAPALPVSRENEAYAAGHRAASQGMPCSPPDGYGPDLQALWHEGWVAEWRNWFRCERRCSECGAAAEGWPDDRGGELCQMCWEEASADLFWELLAVSPGTWADPSEPGGALLEEAV